jgi:perosamine synthetase
MIKLSKPNIHSSSLEDIKKILESGNLIQGEYVANFENITAKYLDIPYVKMVSSGTAALHLSLMALEIGPGDEVIIPAFTFPATANVVEIVGATPLLVDINLSDYCINTNLIEEKITNKTKAIIPVHAFGQAADMDSILDIARKHNIGIIEDAACALGTEYHKQKVGTFGEIGCFSLHPRKAITTGEGGIVITSNKKLAEKIDLLRNHGAKYVNEKLDFVMAGLNYRMTEFQAALGIPQIQEIELLISRRMEQAVLYSKLLMGSENVITPQSYTDRRHIYQTYHVLIDYINRDIMLKILRENKIETNLGAHAINCLTYYQHKYSFMQKDYRNATKAFRQGLALPLGSHITSNDIEQIANLLLKQFDSHNEYK